MCGWVGVFGASACEAVLRAASATIASRGPDGSGELVSVDERLRFGVAHRRLSIQDLSPAGAQPMTDEESGVTVVYNGEIYNAPPLRQHLVARGHRFRSTSDTEVLLRGYVEWGDGVLDRIEGIFSFAIADVPRARTLLARDRFGVKPLYWSLHDGTLIAGSAPRALFALQPRLDRTIDRVAIAQFLTLLWIPHPRTPWQAVKKLPPGHALVFEGGETRQRRFWDLPEPSEDVLAPQDLLEALRSATRRQLLSDVPVGILLSGGLDSTLLAHLMAEQYGGGRLNALTAGYEPSAQRLEIAPDDSRYARMVADTIPQLSLTVVEATADPVEALDELSPHFDDPVADPAAITLYQLCKASSNKVLISGVGGEELWAGYPRHSNLTLASIAATLPEPVRRIACRASTMLYGGRPGPAHGLRRNAQKLARAVGDCRPPHYWRIMAQLTFEELDALIPGAAAEAFDELDGQTSRLDHSKLDTALTFDRRQFLPNLNLAYVDKASMAAGVEVRVPMLDDEVSNLTCRVHASGFLSDGVTKVPLRGAARGLVEREIINRPKSGFGGPARAWFQGMSGSQLGKRVEAVAETEIVERRTARAILRSAVSGRQDSALAGWALVCLHAWSEEHT